MELGRSFTFLNIYGPHDDQVGFWTRLFDSSNAKRNNLIMGGDLYFSISAVKSWGAWARPDPLFDFFFHHLSSSNLIGQDTIRLKPTWRNHRVGDDRVEKRINKFLIFDAPMNPPSLLWHWVGVGGVLDHSPIILELKGHSPKLGSPFKLNAGGSRTSLSYPRKKKIGALLMQI